MRLFFDTETSGLPRPDGERGGALVYPRLAQLGVRLYARDWTLAGRMCVLVRPDGWEIEPGATAVSGLTTLRCQRYGVPAVYALALFRTLTEAAEVIVAFNMEFDRGVIAAECARSGASSLWLDKKQRLCAMEQAVDECALPGKYGFKNPSLEEAHRVLFPDQKTTVRHDADEDIGLTVAVYRRLLDLGRIKEPDPFSAAL